MRVHGGTRPSKFSVETMPNKQGWCLCRFYENAREYVYDDTSGWEYDEYHLQQEGAKESLETDIANNYDVYLAAAKATEAPSVLDRLEAQALYTALMTDTLLEV